MVNNYSSMGHAMGGQGMGQGMAPQRTQMASSTKVGNGQGPNNSDYFNGSKDSALFTNGGFNPEGLSENSPMLRRLSAGQYYPAVKRQQFNASLEDPYQNALMQYTRSTSMQNRQAYADRARKYAMSMQAQMGQQMPSVYGQGTQMGQQYAAGLDAQRYAQDAYAQNMDPSAYRDDYMQALEAYHNAMGSNPYADDIATWINPLESGRQARVAESKQGGILGTLGQIAGVASGFIPGAGAARAAVSNMSGGNGGLGGGGFGSGWGQGYGGPFGSGGRGF
jgi:hypothetical protein